MKKIILSIFFVICQGCISYDYSQTNDLSLEPKPEDCQYRVFTQTPQIPFEEVGVISFGLVFPRTVEGAKKQASNDVRASGANGLILWQVNSAGRYTKATVINTSDEKSNSAQ